jgi:hypothetical protein
MRTWLIIGDVVVLVLLVFLLDATYQTMATQQEQYNETRLSRSVEYAAEAAFAAATNTQETNLSYITNIDKDNYNIPLDTSEVVSTFDTVLSYCYGFAPGSEASANIEDSIGVMVLACTDGYYVLERAQDSENGTGLLWTIKKPYSYELTTKDGEYVTYGLTLNTETFVRVALTGDSSVDSYTVRTGTSYDKTGGEVTDEIRRMAVSSILTDAARYYMTENIGHDPEVSIFLPSAQTLSGINQIAAPSLLVIMDDCPYAGVEETGTSALTGNRLIRKVRVIGYYRNGRALYSYEGQGAADTVSSDGVEYFDTVEEAAYAGYGPDLEYLANAINYERVVATAADEDDYRTAYEEYDPAKNYVAGDYVAYMNRDYFCIADTSGEFNSTCWLEIEE